MWYQWIFYDEDYCSFKFIEGTNLYEVNKQAYEYFNDCLPPLSERGEYEEWAVRDFDGASWKRTDFFDFCKNKPWFIPTYDGPGISITFHAINFKEN